MYEFEGLYYGFVYVVKFLVSVVLYILYNGFLINFVIGYRICEYIE